MQLDLIGEFASIFSQLPSQDFMELREATEHISAHQYFKSHREMFVKYFVRIFVQCRRMLLLDDLETLSIRLFPILADGIDRVDNVVF